MNLALITLVLAAWPLPPDAGRGEFANPSNWPNEPAWIEQWPLLSFTPDAGRWSALSDAERDAGVGMSIDRAFSVTLGAPNVTIAVIAPSFDTREAIVANAWKLNAAEVPDAGDVNGNGRIDVGDFAADPRVTDRNGNGAIDLDDVVRSLSDGMDQDQNGRIDDISGWDFDSAGALFASDAGRSIAPLAAPIDDGLPGVGVCPRCTVVAFADSSFERALNAAVSSGARVVLAPRFDGELSPSSLQALDAGAIVITAGSGSLASFPLAVHPAVWSPRTLTADATSAQSRSGCGGLARGSISVSTTTCEREAATTLAGLAALVLSANPSLDAQQVRGLLGGDRIDAFAAVTRAAGMAPPLIDTAATQVLPLSGATRCFVDGVEVRCDGGLTTGQFEISLDVRPERAFSLFTEHTSGGEWNTWFAAPPQAARRGLVAITTPGWGSRPPRYVDLSGLETDELVFARRAGRLPFAMARIDGDRQSDLIEIDGREVVINGTLLETLDAGALEGPIAIDGTLITLENSGLITVRNGADRWTHQLPALSGPAIGKIDGDNSIDLALADGAMVHVLITDARGPTSLSWTAPSRAREALLGNVAGDAELEVIAEKIFDSRGAVLGTLDGWVPSNWPALLTRADETSARSLVQLESRVDGRVDVARYDVERALRGGDQLIARRVVTALTHEPAPGGMAAVDVTGDRHPDLLIPTLDGLVFIIDLDGSSPPESPVSAWGTVVSAPTVGARDDHVEWSVRNTRGDVVRFLSRGLVEDITWDGPGHDEGNTRNAETPFHARRISGIGIVDPPILQPMCGCSASEGTLVLLALITFLFRRRTRC